MMDAGMAVVPLSKQALIMKNLSDVECRKSKDLIMDALRQGNWDPLIRYGAYQQIFEALIVIN